MSRPFSILHISDLHRSTDYPITNDELISALVGDRDRYIHETPRIGVPEAIVISGDIIQGVPLLTADHETKLAEQYAVAEEFLDELVRRFLDGDRSRVVIVPGNHDIDWNTAFEALAPVAPADMPSNLPAVLHSESSVYRWDWKTLTLYRIADAALYRRRLEAFWRFAQQFYSGVTGLLRVQPWADANLFAFRGNRIGVAAFNSCHGNDCFAFHGLIPKECVARTHLDFNDSGNVFDLQMAVWHHSIEGPPYRTDYMDLDIVRGMIGRGFRLGLYGHQHKAQVSPQEIWLPDRERMALVSAGSLCAGADQLPTGTYRQYNIVEVSDDFKGLRVHVRAMSVANVFTRGRLPEFGGDSYADLNWEPPRNLVGGSVNTAALRLAALIEEAELAAKTGNPARAVEILRAVDAPPASYQRQLLLSAASDARDWSAIVRITNPPVSIEELVQHVEALTRLGSTSDAIAALEGYSGRLQLPAALVAELRRRISSEEAMRQ